jgi:organic radical activating enzyme
VNRSGLEPLLAAALPLRPFSALTVAVDPGGTRWTLRRALNLRLARWELGRGRRRLWSYPLKLTVEAASACNLRCPACFTGVGEIGRRRASMPLELFERLMAELGPYLLQVELCSWGEPMLCTHLPELVAAADRRGVSTSLSTNLSLPLEAERVEALVRSGLRVLGVSIDGATQAVYERYRVRGDLALVLRNCRLFQEVKARLGSSTPRLVWGYHVFPHNEHEVAAAAEQARELEMDFGATRGWLVGGEWDLAGRWPTFAEVRPMRCGSLWHHAVVSSDGGVTTCGGAFYRQDDVGQMTGSFRSVWNGAALRRARGFYRKRRGDEAARRALCFDCPATVNWEAWRKHREAGGGRGNFVPSYSGNDGFNYFWARRSMAGAGAAPGATGTGATPAPG